MPGARKNTALISVDTPWFQSRAVELGDFTVAFETIRQERDSTASFKGLPDERCPCPHWGLVVSGRFTSRYRDHDETFEAGDVYYAAPGHLPHGTAGTELITFSPTVELEKVNAVLAKNRARRGASQSTMSAHKEIDTMSTLNTEPRRKRLPFVGLAEGHKPVPFIPLTVRATAEETGGTFELYELAAPAGRVREVVGGGGPPPHVHREHEEAFYILEGEFTFILGDDNALAPKGTLVVVPRGTRHGFSAKEGSRALVLAIPGGLAGFFEELGAGLAAGRADADLRVALAGKYDSYPEVP